MKNSFFTMAFLLLIVTGNAQPLTSFEFTATHERTVTIGQPPPVEYAKPMNPKLISYKDKVLTITTISTGKDYSKLKVIRVIDFSKDNSKDYALEVLDENGLYNYYLYHISKSISGDESKSLVTPFVVKGRLIMEDTFFE